MSDNLELGRLETNIGVAAVNTFDTLASRVDARETEPLVKAVTSSNAVTITQNELRFVNSIRFTDSGSSAAITATIDTDDDDQSPPVAKSMGSYDVINLTANAITIEVSGQSATAPVVAAGETARINVTATDVRGIGGAGGGGGGGTPDDNSVSTAKIQDNAVTLDKMEHGTQGDILYYGASGVPTRLSAGTSGHVLKTQGAAANPVWEAAPAGGGGSVDAEEGGATIVGGASAFNFAAADFNVTDEGSGVAGIALAGGGGGSSAHFSAHKNGTDQTGILADTLTKLTFATEAFDVGGHYDTSTSRWTPPAGPVIVSACARITAGVVDQGVTVTSIRKNGSDFKAGPITPMSGTAYPVAGGITVIDVANGTDFYEAWVFSGGTGNKTVGGNAIHSYFMGWAI